MIESVYKYEHAKIIDYLGKGKYNKLKELNVFLAGGALLSIFSNTEVADFDLYFRDRSSLLSFYMELEEGAILSYTNRSLLIVAGGIKYNLIFFNFFNTLQDVFNSFDFTIVMAGFDFASEQFVFDDRFHRDIIGKKLVYSATNQYPIGTLLRLKKYEEKGFKISRRELIKIALKVSFLNIKTIGELEDHINGMYGANLYEVWDDLNLKEVTPENIMILISSLDPPVTILDDGAFIGNVSCEDGLQLNLLPELPKMSIHKAIEDCNINEKFFYDFCDKIYIEDIGNNYYIIKFDNLFTDIIEDVDFIVNLEKQDLPKKVSLSKKESFITYKDVVKKGTHYFSYHDTDYQYAIGEWNYPSNPDSRGSGIYTNINHINASSSNTLGSVNNDNHVLLELKVSTKDIKNNMGDGLLVFNKVFVNKEVGK